MDLVDIDQVLDNLELCEEVGEQKKVVQCRRQTPSMQTSLNTSNINGRDVSAEGLVIMKKNTNASGSKAFVGVSQVFHSLDDYRKDVQSLETSTSLQKYDGECRTIQNTADLNKDLELPQYVGNSINSSLQNETISPAQDFKDSNHNKSKYLKATLDEMDSNKDEVYYEQEETTNDIRKFTVKSDARSNQFQNDEEDVNTSSSDSLTTSSSTFSSGPFPGLASTTDEHSALLSQADLEQRSALLTTDLHESQQLENEREVNTSMLSQNYTAILGGNRAALEDLADGLSSISLTTADSPTNMPCVSSALKGVFGNLSDSTTTSMIRQLRDNIESNDKQACVSYGESASFPKKKVKNVGGDFVDKGNTCIHSDEKNQDLQSEDSRSIQQNDQKQLQPVTFGSTIDEISDTELDSMLQEMDIDDVFEDIARIGNTEKNEVLVSEAEVNLSTDVNVEKGTHASAEYDVGDYLNADSFSQASTVEFSEIRARLTDVTHGVEFEQCNNSISTSYTSSESSLDVDVGGIAEELSKTRPQRPTTLDLPITKMSLYASAGQTPPGCKDSSNNAPDSTEQPPTEIGNVNETNGSVSGDLEYVEDGIGEASGYSDPHANIGKMPPIWVPDNMANACMQCLTKFTMIKRRHHCRACGKVLCSICCSQKFKLQFLPNPESRVCVQCYDILSQRQETDSSQSGVDKVEDDSDINNIKSIHTDSPILSPNPNNPMEYCSTIPPYRQVSSMNTQPPSVIVPVGVLKKDGSYSSNSSSSNGKKCRKRKSVMFSDGIAPGSELASIEHQWVEAKHARRWHHQNERARPGSSAHKPPTPARSETTADSTAMGLVAQLFRGSIPPVATAAGVSAAHITCPPKSSASNKKLTDDMNAASNTRSVTFKKDQTVVRNSRIPPFCCDENGFFIPEGPNCLPPLYVSKDENSTEFEYKEVANNYELIERLKSEVLTFALQKNFFILVKIVHLKCCMNRTVINFTTCGMHHVGNDEIIILLEYDPPANKELMFEPPIPNDIFVHLNELYHESELGNPVADLSYTSPRSSNFLQSREYGGFIYVRATFQCLQDVIVPENPFLIGILIHRCEVPWAKVFPLRLVLRLGAQYRYYPCPHISMRNRESVYAEIAQTIINFLADFRNFSYTLPNVRGMFIHMEDRQTTVLIPRNRLDDVIKAINNSSDHILAFGGNFSKSADGHLVCMQNVNDARAEMYSYSTQAINIQGQSRKVTGASFFVLNEALKTTSGLSGKCSIVEDGLMVQILPSKMEEVRNALRNQKDIDIVCGPLHADLQQTEIVSIKWKENDKDINNGVKSPIDDKPMDGIASMRVHASFNYSNANYSIRLTDIYVLKFDEWYNTEYATLNITSSDITRIAEQIARSTSLALVPYLDLLAASGNIKIGLRSTLHQDSVCYEAGTRGKKLPPLYMNALDDHLIPTLHNESSGIEEAIILELIFYILNV